MENETIIQLKSEINKLKPLVFDLMDKNYKLQMQNQKLLFNKGCVSEEKYDDIVKSLEFKTRMLTRYKRRYQEGEQEIKQLQNKIDELLQSIENQENITKNS